MFAPGKFTAILTVITAVVAFYVTSVVEEIRSGPSASYAVERGDRKGERVFVLENLSRTHAIRGAQIQLWCKDGSLCFKKFQNKDEEVYAAQRIHAPNLPNFDLKIEGAPPAVSFCLSAIASSKSAVRVSSMARPRDIVVLYDPWSDKCGVATGQKPLLLMKKWNPHAAFARWYFEVFSIVLALSALYFLLMLIAILREVFAAGQEKDMEE